MSWQLHLVDIMNIEIWSNHLNTFSLKLLEISITMYKNMNFNFSAKNSFVAIFETSQQLLWKWVKAKSWGRKTNDTFQSKQ